MYMSRDMKAEARAVNCAPPFSYAFDQKKTEGHWHQQAYEHSEPGQLRPFCGRW